MEDTSVVVKKINAMILEVETNRGDIRQIRFSGRKDCKDDEAKMEMEIDKFGSHHKVNVEFPFEGTIRYEIIA